MRCVPLIAGFADYGIVYRTLAKYRFRQTVALSPVKKAKRKIFA